MASLLLGASVNTRYARLSDHICLQQDDGRVREPPRIQGPRAHRSTAGMASARQRLIVGVSGASGVVYGLRALDACRELGVESHLVMSKAAALTLAQETAFSVADVN